MSQIVVHGETIFLAGQVADQRSLPIADQTRQTLDKIEALLKEVGASRSDLVAMTVYLAHAGDFAAMNEVYDAWIDKANPPARTCIEARLAHSDLRVEITAVAESNG
jgi:enamine deaminase RidA (YjgF/YER057c/UK114 family)